MLGCQIHTHADGSLNGRGIYNIYRPDSLVIFYHLHRFAGQGAKAGDTDAENKLLLFTEYLLSEGLAEGGRIVLQTNSYPNARTFPVGFLEALPYIRPAFVPKCWTCFKWNNEYSVVNGATSAWKDTAWIT